MASLTRGNYGHGITHISGRWTEECGEAIRWGGECPDGSAGNRAWAAWLRTDNHCTEERDALKHLLSLYRESRGEELVTWTRDEGADPWNNADGKAIVESSDPVSLIESFTLAGSGCILTYTGKDLIINSHGGLKVHNPEWAHNRLGSYRVIIDEYDGSIDGCVHSITYRRPINKGSEFRREHDRIVAEFGNDPEKLVVKLHELSSKYLNTLR